MSDVVVPIVSKRRERVQLAQKLQHALPAVVLLFEGFARMSRPGPLDPSRWLGAFEAGTSFLVLAAVARSVAGLRDGSAPPRRRHVHPSQVDGVDIALGLMLAIEVIVDRVEMGYWRRPSILLAVATLVVGLCHGRLATWSASRRAMRVTDAGVSVGTRFFRRRAFAWGEIERIDIEERTASIVGRDGRAHAFDLRDLRHAHDVTRALTRARARLDAHSEVAAAHTKGTS
jgi:hypothetical protein